jgi:hypothetical protein
MTPPSLAPSLLGLPAILAGLFATDGSLSNLLHQARGIACCQFFNVFTVIYLSRSPAHSRHIYFLSKDRLITEIESHEIGSLVTVSPKMGTEHLHQKGMTSQLLKLSLSPLKGHETRILVDTNDRPPCNPVFCQ